jgi:hypothetical protein
MSKTRRLGGGLGSGWCLRFLCGIRRFGGRILENFRVRAVKGGRR